MAKTTTIEPVTLAERIHFAGAALSRELLAELRAKGAEGVALLEAEIEKAGKRVHYAGILKLAIAWVQGRFEEELAASLDRSSDDLLGALRRDPASFFRPRRAVAFEVLHDAVQAWIFGPAFHRRFLAVVEKLTNFEATGEGDLDEPFEREGAKVGRNDPCPCGSGKKFKKCCGHATAQGAVAGRSIGELLRDARYEYGLYTLDFEEQLSLVGPEAFRAHLEILASPTRVRASPGGDPYLVLAAVSREIDRWEPGPRWIRDAALELIEGPGHAAADRGELASWLLSTREEEADELAPRIVKGLSRGLPLPTASAAAAVTSLGDSHPDLALELLRAPTVSGDDPRIAILRAVTAYQLEDDLYVLEQLERASGLVGNEPQMRGLYVAICEAIAALDDPPLETASIAPGSGTAPPASQERSPNEVVARRHQRTAPFVDTSLSSELETVLAESGARAAELEASVTELRAEEAGARAEVHRLEELLAEARSRATRFRRSLEKAERSAEDARRGAPLAALDAALKRLADDAAVLRARTSGSASVSDERVVSVLVAHASGRALVLLPLRPEAARGEGESVLVDLALASVASVGEVLGVVSSAHVAHGDALGWLAIVVDRASLDVELLAASLDATWSRLPPIEQARVVPTVCPVSHFVAEELVGRVAFSELTAPGDATTAPATGPLPIVVAADLLGLTPFAVALDLGARGLWTGSTVAPSIVELLRRPSEDAAALRALETEPSESNLESDPHPARRTLRVILRRLLRLGKIGASHTRIDNTLRGAAPHLRGLMKDVMLALLRLGVLRRKPTLNGLHVSIEPDRVPEVTRLVATGEVPWEEVGEMLGM